MTKRFELKVNQHNQCDIVDWVESKEKNAICIYNDLGDYYFSSAKALCGLLNELAEEKEYYQIKSGKCEEELLKLRRDNEQLKQFKENVIKWVDSQMKFNAKKYIETEDCNFKSEKY